MGRVAATRKTLNSITKQANFTYNLDGTVNTLQDFGGTTLTYSYTPVGLQKGVTDGAGNTYASSGVYDAAGQLTALTHQLTSSSAILQRTLGYDSLLQPNTIVAKSGTTNIQSLTLGYGTSGQNNGNIATIANGMDTSHGRDQTYTYDTLNRVYTGGDASHWGEQYGYDNWGNMLSKTVTRGTGTAFTVSDPNGTNQLSNQTYDNAGNVVLDQQGNHFSYDAEGRIITGGTGTYTYDGDGNRVVKTNGSATTLYWPSSVAGVVDESNSTATAFGRQIFVGGVRVWSEDTAGSGRFLFQDHLGSTRVTASSAGSVKDDYDYRSFGNVVANYGAAPSDNHYVFTGYESDYTDNGTDFGQFRSLSLTMARFNRPDPYLGSYDPTNPQSFNRFGYVLNNPLSLIDPSGLSCITTTVDSSDTTSGSDDLNTTIQDDGDGLGCADIGIPASIQTEIFLTTYIPPNNMAMFSTPNNQQQPKRPSKEKPWYCGSGNSWSHPLTAPTSKQWGIWGGFDTVVGIGIAKYTKGYDGISDVFIFSGAIETLAGAECSD